MKLKLQESLALFRLRYTTDKKFRAITLSYTVLGACVVTALSYATAAFFDQNRRPTDSLPIATAAVPTAKATPTATPKPALAPSLLDGTMQPLGQEDIEPLAVMIENHPDARPQYGLGTASQVYEAIAEGGITRFMAIFRDPNQNVRVGPVRSARTYYVNFAREFGPLYAHAGGNRDALDLIPTVNLHDLDGLIIGNPIFFRDTSRGVASEHTLFSRTDLLWNYATDRLKISKQANFATLRYQDSVPTDLPASQVVTVNFSDSLYAVSWNYDKASNSYLRTMAGTAHRDANNGEQIRTTNIVLQTVAKQSTTTKIGENGFIFTTRDASGAVVVIRNGVAIKGTWRQSGNDRTRYYDSSGNEIALARGTTWVEVVHAETATTY